jgi:hypothetical protein
LAVLLLWVVKMSLEMREWLDQDHSHLHSKTDSSPYQPPIKNLPHNCRCGATATATPCGKVRLYFMTRPAWKF